MPRYSEERRQAVVAKLLPPHNLSPQVITEQEGISLGTVYTWRKEARAEGRCLSDALGKGVDGWSSKDKFSAVVETASMNARGPGSPRLGLGLRLTSICSDSTTMKPAKKMARPRVGISPAMKVARKVPSRIPGVI
jgi:hypothetical protein